MADKRYIDFDPGSANSTDILLLADPATGLLKQVTASGIFSAKGFSEYRSVITQTSTDPPAVVFDQLPAGSITWSRISQGEYNGTFSVGWLTDSKTIILVSATATDGVSSTVVLAGCYRVDASTIRMVLNNEDFLNTINILIQVLD